MPSSTRSGSRSRPRRKPAEADPEDAGKDEETLKAEYKAIADRRVRLGLLVAEIGRANEVQVTEQELQRAMFNEAMRYGYQAMQVVEFFRKNPQQMERFRGPIFEDKVIDFLLGSVKQDEVQVSAGRAGQRSRRVRKSFAAF